MTASIIQANYEQLEQIATRFGRATEAQDRLMRTIRDRADVLTRGSWEGEGGDAFARELDGEVMPAMQRLADALQEAQRATLKMSVVIRTAEEEAARLFISDSVAAGVISDETGRNLTDTISSAGELEPPNSMGDLYALIEDPDAPPIQISKLPNGEYLVLIKGTDGWTGGSNVWSTNVYTGIGLPSVYTKRIQQAIAEQIPPGSTIHFAGHSQGGHAVQVIGAQYYRNGDYKIGSITSFGANYSAVIPLGLRDRMNAYLFWNDPLNAANVVDSTHVDSYLIHPSEKVLYKGGSLNPIIAHGDYENSPYLQQTNVPFDVGTGHTLPTIGYDAPQEPISAVILGDIDRALGGDGIL